MSAEALELPRTKPAGMVARGAQAGRPSHCRGPNLAGREVAEAAKLECHAAGGCDGDFGGDFDSA